MITSNRIIFEIPYNLSLASIVHLAQKARARDCLIKIKASVIFSQAIRLLSSAAQEDDLRKMRCLGNLIENRFFFDTQGSNLEEIMHVCSMIEPKAISVESSMWGKFFPWWHTHGPRKIAVYGSLGEELTLNGDSDSNNHVVVELADQLLKTHGADGIICNSLSEGIAVGNADFKKNGTFSIICHMQSAAMICDNATVEDAVAAGVDGFIVTTRVENDFVMDKLANAIKLVAEEV